MTPATEKLFQQELRVRRWLRMPGMFFVFLALVLIGLIFAAGVYRIAASLLGVE